MANNIRLLRRLSGDAGSPSSLRGGEPAHNEVEDVLYIGKGDDGNGNATQIVPVAGSGAFVNKSANQTINGVKTFSNAPKSSADGSASNDLVRKSQLDLKAPLSSPALTGNPTAPTQTAGDNSTKIATTSYVETAVAAATIDGIGEIGDVTITSVVDGEVLVYDSTSGDWINRTLSEAGIAAADHQHDASDIISGTLPVARGGTGSGTASGARSALGLVIGTDVQAHSSVLDNTTASFTTAEQTKLGHIAVTQAVDLDEIETRVSQLDAAVVLKGSWDASTGSFPGGGSAQAGESYIVSTGGTVDGVDFVANDRILALVDNASTSSYATNWLKLDYTDEVLSVAGKTGAVTLAASDIASGTFADARIAQSSVTQHQAALSITESQISDLAAYITDITGENIGDLSNVSITSVTDGELFVYDNGSGSWINRTLSEAGVAAENHTHGAGDITSGTFADARIAQSNVTQHQGALAISSSQVSGLGTMAAQDASNVDINGGTIDGVTLDGGTF